MSITMYNKKTGKNVKVYGFVQANAGMYGGRGHTYAVTYQLNVEKQHEKFVADMHDKPFECLAEDLELKLVLASDLRPLEA